MKMARKNSKWLYLVVALAAVLSFAGGMRYGPVLMELFRSGEKEENEKEEPSEKTPLDPDDEEEAERLEEMVRRAAAEYRADPVDAVYNSSYNVVLPGVNGYEIDEEATLERLKEADPGEAVAPVWRELKANATAGDYPTAIIDRGYPGRRQVSLMINVAWGNEYLPQMLDVLDQYDVKTTFFIVGRWADRFPELLQELDRRGHELGNHGYDDSEVFADLDYTAAAASLRRTDEAIDRLTGQKPRWFTPHRGEYNRETLEAAADRKMRLLLWTLDTVDWQRPGEEAMARRILDNLVPGTIILMHPTEQSAGFLRAVLPELSSRGYRIVTMSELLSSTPEYPEVYFKK